MKWNDSDVQFLIKHYPHMLSQQIADKIGVEVYRVYNKAHQLGLKKTKEFLSSESSGRGNLLKAGMKHRFKKGDQAWNKGKRFISGGNSFKTQFKKGRVPANYKPVGSERVTRDGGYIEVKIKDPRTWRLKHLHVWESENGKLPKGHCLSFKDGNKQNIEIDNLECITRSENMKRNSIHRYPKEIALAMQMMGALKRRINHEQR